MPNESQFLVAETQTVLNEMWAQNLTPFRLEVGSFTVQRDGYVIEFHDSRIHSVRIPLAKGRVWKELVRDAVLQRVK